MLFSNQISARELISGNQSDCNRDFSQLQNAKFTQFEMSQTESQDCFSQQDQYSAGSSQDIHSQGPQGRRMSSYERYISKPLFGGNSQSRSTSRSSHSQKQGPPKVTTSIPSYQHQLNAVKGRVKEKEEKDMLSSIVSIVKECSDEVKQNLNCLKEADQDKGDMLMKAIDKLTHAVEENSGKILNAIHSREELVSQSFDLHTEISKKDKQIQDLLKQSTQSCAVENSKTMENAMKTFLEQQHEATEQKLQKLLDITKDQFGLVQDIEACQKSGHENNKKHQTDWKYSNQRQLQDMEKRLQSELVTLRDEFDSQKRDMESFYKNQLQSFLQKYVRDIEHQIQRGLQNSVYSISEHSQGMSRDQQTELRDALRQQQREMEANIIFQTSNQSEKMLKHHMEQSMKSCKDLKKDLSGKLELMQTQQKKMLEDNNKQFQLLKDTLQSSERPWQNDNVPQQVQEQLNELHDNHMSEIKRLEREIEKERKEKEQNEELEQRNRQVLECTSPLENVYDFMDYDTETRRNDTTSRKSGGSMFGKATSFLSPRPPTGMTWNSKSLFGRTNPSPVATVLPQRKCAPQNQLKPPVSTATSSDNGNHNTAKPQRQLRSNTKQILPSFRDQIQHDEAVVSNNNTTEIITYGKKLKSGGQKTKRGKGAKAGLCHKEFNEEINNKANQHLSSSINMGNIVGFVKPVASKRQLTKTKTKSIYDFNDDSPARPTERQNNSLQIQEAWNTDNRAGEQSLMMSPVSDSSGQDSSNSSPSLSVTEVFIRRRIRHEVKTPIVKADSQQDVALPDFLSTPTLTGLFTDRNTQVMDNLQTRNNSTVQRLAERRKLCDFNTEVIQTIQCSNKRRKYRV